MYLSVADLRDHRIRFGTISVLAIFKDKSYIDNIILMLVSESRFVYYCGSNFNVANHSRYCSLNYISRQKLVDLQVNTCDLGLSLRRSDCLGQNYEYH